MSVDIEKHRKSASEIWNRYLFFPLKDINEDVCKKKKKIHMHTTVRKKYKGSKIELVEKS